MCNYCKLEQVMIAWGTAFASVDERAAFWRGVAIGVALAGHKEHIDAIERHAKEHGGMNITHWFTAAMLDNWYFWCEDQRLHTLRAIVNAHGKLIPRNIS